MRDDITPLISKIQASMTESAKSCFESSELSELYYLIRVTGQFFEYLQRVGANLHELRLITVNAQAKRPSLPNGAAKLETSWSGSAFDAMDHDARLRYVIETVFNAVNSFSSVSAAYRVLVGAKNTTVNWDEISLSTFSEHFTNKFQEFVSESKFEDQCRLLLDLFKLQLVFAGFLYD